MKAGLLTACALALAPLLASGQEVQVNSGHVGAVNDLVFDQARDLLFSAGEDGTVRVWEPSGRMRASLRVSPRPVQRLALHPRLPQLAALVGEASKVDTLAAWDWEQGRELYSLGSETQLLHLAYAPHGGYLAYSRADYRSLAAVDPASGRPLGMFPTGFGMVSWFAVSRGENTVMGYQPSGWITYWDAVGNRSLRQLRTMADLSQLHITPSNRHVLAVAGDRLVAVDLLTGALAAEEETPGLSRIALSLDGEQVAGAAGPVGALRWWRFGAAGLQRIRGGAGEPGRPAVTALAYGRSGLYTGDREGELAQVAGDGSRQLVARNILLPVTGLALRGDAAAVATPSWIYLIRSDFLRLPLGAPSVGTVSRLPAPFAGPFGLAFLDDRRLLAWRRGEEPGELAELDIASGLSRTLPVAFDSSIQQVSLTTRGLILVERGGLCRILDPITLETRFRYTARAVNRLAFTRGDLLVGAGAAAFGSSLFQIDEHTGEMVPIRDPSLFVYDLLYSASGASLYSLAVEQQAQGARTVLAVHSGRQLETRQVLDSYAGEDIGASLAEDAAGRVYCSLGFDGPSVWDGSRLSALPNPGRIARRLVVHGDKLFAVNTDFTVSVWDAASPAAPWRVCLFAEGEWALLGPQGEVYASPGARGFLLVNRGRD